MGFANLSEISFIHFSSTNNVKPHYAHCKSKYGQDIFWYQQLPDVPRKFSFYVAHEFFDALPIHKFQVKIFPISTLQCTFKKSKVTHFFLINLC